jgi:hypothetical protein
MIAPVIGRQGVKGTGNQERQNDSFNDFAGKTAGFHFDALENSDIFN